jgi:hypothetical protein|tara:strand:+ start:9845 stop:10666 length:822 start_codon:yes stop_codon:yes gene_type:complete
MTNKPVAHTIILEEEQIFVKKTALKRNPLVRVIEPEGAKGRNFYVKPSDPNVYFPTIWIVSPGNSGSSLLHDNLKKSYDYHVYKSHSYHIKWKNMNCLRSTTSGQFMWEIEPQDKVIYLYSHPLNILISYHNKISTNPEHWYKGNPAYVDFLECDIEQDFNENYLYKDILNLERHFDKWWRQNDFDTLCIKYENLYDCQKIIQDFIGAPQAISGEIFLHHRKRDIELPPKRSRKTDWTKDPHKDQLIETYASIVEKFNNKPDYELFLKKRDDI